MYTHFLHQAVIEINDNLMKIFNDYGFYDISYGNDCCNSVAYDIDDDNFFQVFIPNSLIDDARNEHFNKFTIMIQNPNHYTDNIFELYDIFDNIEDVLGFVESNKDIKL
jgi:hypothetical protein